MSNSENYPRVVYVSAEELAKVKQDSRDRDAAALASGKMSQKDLIKKNDIFAGIDFSKAKIISVGDKKYEDID